MTLKDMETVLRVLHSDKKRGLPLLDHETTRDRISESRMRDLGTHLRTIAAVVGKPASEIDPRELTVELDANVRNYLSNAGKGQAVIDSTIGTIRLLRDLAIEQGVEITTPPVLVRPARNSVYRAVAGTARRYVKVSRAAFVSNNAKYGASYATWPEETRREFDLEIKPFFNDPLAEKRSKKRTASDDYMKTWMNRAERAFGYLVSTGVPVAELSFKRLMDYPTLLGYYRWLYARRSNRHTTTTKGDLDQWRHLAKSFYGLDELAGKLKTLIYERTEWVTTKDKDDLVLRVHPDDLYVVFYALIAEAEHYEKNVATKYGREDPMAVAAHKWNEAGVWGLTLISWLREKNVANVTTRQLIKQDDGTWFFRFPAADMKSKRDHSDHVIDFWRRAEADLLMARVLDKVVQMRPHLIARFRRGNPGAPDPATFFLNLKGRAYSRSAIRVFFYSASVRYLGAEKAISPHEVRTIVPSWLFVREGDEILRTVQRRLDHSNIKTTEACYLKIEKLFHSRLSRLRMEERDKQRKAQERLTRLPDEVAALLMRFKDEILSAQSQQRHQIDQKTLRDALLELLSDKENRQGEEPS